MMRVHWLQHVPFEGLGCIESYLQAAGDTLTHTPLFEADAKLPDLDSFDCLIVMGGPMSVHDEADYPWLVAEKRLIRAAIDAEKRVLGICLGAQLIADVMGAKVYPNGEKEIGWFPIDAKKNQVGDWLPSSLQVFHWHGETFDLPSGAQLLASSEVCQHQIFLLGDRVLGLQCHLEATPESARMMVEHGENELVDLPYVQREVRILSEAEVSFTEMHAVMNQLIERLRRGLNG